jgi:lipopolysaccharide transport system ATP-binding protein
MNEPIDATLAVKLAGISKTYRRVEGRRKTFGRVFGNGETGKNEFVALAPLDLEVKRGESLGIVGRNGSGKSTLLKIIAGVLKQTTGTYQVNGRISALLELGSGFNPDFTGKENVRYNARMLGLTTKELDDRYDEIIRFADIGTFLDQPVKTYSSGMAVRLAFAVAINVNPEILIVDEALAVGDVFFQQKCFEKVRQLRQGGMTLLFVSHDIGAVYKNCTRAILLDHGNLVLDASPREVADLYQAQLVLGREEEAAAAQAPPDDATGDSVPRVTDAPTVKSTIRRENGDPIEVIVSGERLSLAARIHFPERSDDPHVAFSVRDRLGSVIFETNTYCMQHTIGPVDADEEIELSFSFALPLFEGEYTLTIGVAEGGYGDGLFKRQLHTHDAGSIKVLRNLDSIVWAGLVNLDPTFRVESSIPNRQA